MSEIRSVKYNEGDAGVWSLDCASCPLTTHAKALRIAGPHCMSGIATNMQGQIVLGQCDHYENKSINATKKKLYIQCNYAPLTTGSNDD